MAVESMLVTCAGSIIFPELSRIIRETYPGISIHGIDEQDSMSARQYTDKFTRVPNGNSDEYVDAVLSLHSSDHFQVILPMSDEEALALSAQRDVFDDCGAYVLVNSHELTQLCRNKATLFAHLDSLGFDLPRWAEFRSAQEAVRALEEVGYPESDVIIKPSESRGSRGFWVVTEKVKALDYLYGRDRVYIQQSWLMDLLNQLSDAPSMVAMELLAGPQFSVDILGSAHAPGQLLGYAPHLRTGYRWGRLDRGRIDNFRGVEAEVIKITRLLGVQSLANVEFGEGRRGSLGLIEVNPRASATLALSARAGSNLLKWALDEVTDVSRHGSNPTERPSNSSPVSYSVCDLNVVLSADSSSQGAMAPRNTC